jgi:replication initiation and membrane attachment protein DnaB
MDALASSMRDNLKYDYMSSPKAAPKTKGDSSLARMIRSMDELTPVEFLKRLQKGHKPATSDLRLLEKLSEETGLAPGATNALVFFVLSKNGVLSPLYVEKIGASLVREGIETAIDAMNYFNRTSKKKKPSEPIAEENKVTVEQIKENEGKEGEDDSFEKVVSSLHWKKRKSE